MQGTMASIRIIKKAFAWFPK